jgi:hypothetical protein
VNVVGLHSNEFQVGRVRKYVAKSGLFEQVTLVKGYFIQLAEQFG